MKVYRVELLTEDGTERTERIELPDQASEITLLQWCRVQAIPPPPMLEEQQEVPAGDEGRVIHWLTIMEYAIKVLKVFNVKEGTILDSNLLELTGNHTDGLLAMFVDLLSSINGYRPMYRDKFTHHGRTFSFPENVQQSYGQLLIGGKMSLGQAADALQLDQALSRNDEEGNDLIEDQRYHRDIAVVASLSREVVNGQAERPPLDWIDRRAWLDERIELFTDLPMDIALDGCFFLSALKQRLLTTASSALRLRRSLLARL